MLLERAVVCFECKSVLAEPESIPSLGRPACPVCGSHDCAVQVVTAGRIRSLDDLQLDFQDEERASSAATPPHEKGSNAVEGAPLVVVQREFSDDRDLYIEHVEDEATGAVLWHLESHLKDYRRSHAGSEVRGGAAAE